MYAMVQMDPIAWFIMRVDERQSVLQMPGRCLQMQVSRDGLILEYL